MTYNSMNDNPEDSCHIINKHNISIDRIDSNVGYTKDNVRLVCAIINSVRFDFNDDEEDTFFSEDSEELEDDDDEDDRNWN